MAKTFFMGGEVEYSMFAAGEAANQNREEPSMVRDRLRIDNRRGEFHQHLLAAIRQLHHWLPDVRTPSGIYLDNGSRYYLDSGHHNELSSPEVVTPRQMAIYDRAGERILLRAQRLVEEQHGTRIGITKNNVNFSMPERAAWGQHEAFMSWIPLEEAAPQLIPHLVSRVAYAGAGCLTGHPNGNGFELSQRARHMTRLTGKETTHDRAIFCTRAWKSSDVSQSGWIRTNLIAKDSQRCSFGMYLTYGVTGLLYMIMNEGHRIGKSVQLKNAVEAMRTFSLDPMMKATVPLANGNPVTAIDIQRSYWCEARPLVESGDFPDWTVEVLHHWEATLDQLESDPMQLADRLDPYLKLAVFHRQLERSGTSWDTLRRALEATSRLRSVVPPRYIQAILSTKTEDRRIMEELVTPNVRDVSLDDLRFAVRMQALELNYHELGGLFESLETTGAISPVVVTDDEVEHAIHNPPTGSRAEARSKAIEEMHGKPWVADWQYVLNYHDRKWFDLRNPETTCAEVASLADEDPHQHPLAEIQDILMRFT